jgi:uncharacterized iron-regulated protein
MTTLRLLLLLSLVAGSCLLPPGAAAHPHLLAANERQKVDFAAMLRDLATARVIFIGELHNHPGHHQAQLSIIRALAADRRPLAIGLEMFRKESQGALDRWVGGDYPIERFIRDFEDNWSLWETYDDIFRFAREERIELIGLNIPRSISGQVARGGFASLPEAERRALGEVRCVVSPEYEGFIRQAMGGHGGHGQQFRNFCEAQLLWDTMMARHLADFLRDNPEHRVVVLTGSGHAWKHGMPRQLEALLPVPYRVVLPEVDSRIGRDRLTPEIADYLWLDVGEDGWSL